MLNGQWALNGSPLRNNLWFEKIVQYGATPIALDIKSWELELVEAWIQSSMWFSNLQVTTHEQQNKTYMVKIGH